MTETTDASAIFAPIWRRKWLILIVAILVAAATYVYYKHQRANYTAATQIYLGAGAEEQAGIGISTKKAALPEASAQAVLINSQIIRSLVNQQLRSRKKTAPVRTALRGKIKAKANSEKGQFINLTAEARNGKGASLLANLTAQIYVNRLNARHRSAVEHQISLTRRQIHRIEAAQEQHAAEEAAAASKSKGKGSSAKGKGSTTSVALQVAQLSSKVNQLESELGIVTAREVGKARATKISKSPKKNAVFGFVVGLLLASFLAYALARLDNRLRTLTEIESAFGMQILTALPAVRRPIVHEHGQPRPSRMLLEPLQRLSTSLQVGMVPGPEGTRRPRTVLFLSAQSGDGQSTVLADLSLVQRDAGMAVALIDADLRRPSLARMLDLEARQGLADVLEGRLNLAEAMLHVDAAGTAAAVPGDGIATAVRAPHVGSVAILAGAAGGNRSALLGAPAMAEVLQAVAEEFDFTLLDAPPALEVSDAIPLLRLVDGIVIVARAGQTREVAARRLVQLLERTPSAPVLGVVANGVSQKDIERYGFSTFSRGSWRRRLIGR
jgi:Mrp family chromosome partitioning ATPase/capsular polysaccharide biosynthesis protein